MPRPADNDHPYGERILQLFPECKGRDVWELQIKLIGWGSGSDNDGIGSVLDPVKVTGTFDTTTRDAVMRFQKAHKLPVTGVVDAQVFRAIDREAALHPILIQDLRCPCALGKNDGPILCRCEKHFKDDGSTASAKCTGFGNKGFAGKPDKYLVHGKKLADGTDISGEKLDVYDKEEYEGMDKAVLWAVRALHHRAGLQKDEPAEYKRIKVVSGYRCWHDNYHHTDDLRWRHRRLTFYLGKAIEFHVEDHCTEKEWKKDKDSCPQCDAIRKVAQEKCGFQLRWQEENRVAIAEGSKQARAPATPFSVHLDTVRRLEREKDEFVKSDADAIAPLYPEKIASVSFPLVVAEGVDKEKLVDVRWALDPKSAPSEEFFRNTEAGPGGWFPMGASRVWHGGIHLYAAAGTEVRAIADGEIVGCRVGQDENQDHGSRNFVLVKHTIKAEGTWKDKVFYCLYMHLDGEKAAKDAKVAWRRHIFHMTKDHVEVLAPAPIYEKKQEQVGANQKDRLRPVVGLDTGEIRPVKADPSDATVIDDQAPEGSKVVELTEPADRWFFTRREKDDLIKSAKKEFGTKRAAVAGLTDKLTNGVVIGLEFPIKVRCGELIGKVAAAAKSDPVKKLGAFLHLETFAKEALPVTGFVAVDASAKDKIADRKEVVAALAKAKLIPEPPDGVLLDSEAKDLVAHPPHYVGLRSAELKMPSAWSIDWKDALKTSQRYGFMKDDQRDALGDAWNSYCWWKDVKAMKGDLPASETVFHYHPIALILQIAYA